MKARLQAVHPVLMVRDVAAAIRFYAQLGFEVAFSDSDTDPKYAGVRRDEVELHLQWHAPEDFAPGDRPTYRFLVAEVDELLSELSWTRGVLDIVEPPAAPAPLLTFGR